MLSDYTGRVHPTHKRKAAERKRLKARLKKQRRKDKKAGNKQ